MKTVRLLAVFALLGSLFAWVGCEKEEGTSKLTVKMTDAPAEYDSVLVDIKSVEVHYEDGEGPDGEEGWVTLATNAGVYNLLDLQNGVTVVLSDGIVIPSGKISQIRFVLGSNNSVVLVGGASFQLATPSAQQSGLKVNVHQELEPDHVYEITLDFDASQSIVIQGNGDYSLKPVITVHEVIEI